MRSNGVLIAVVIGSFSCGMGMSGAASTKALSEATNALSQRVEAHHARVFAAKPRDAALAEVDAYAAAAPPILATAINACGGKMMPGLSTPEFMADLLAAAVREHSAQMHAASTLTDIEALCEAHVARMRALVEHLQSMIQMMMR